VALTKDPLEELSVQSLVKETTITKPIRIKRAARTLPDVFDRVTLPTIETCDIATAQSLQYVSPDAALEYPDPIFDHT
jgi:hypothetical protein